MTDKKNPTHSSSKKEPPEINYGRFYTFDFDSTDEHKQMNKEMHILSFHCTWNEPEQLI